MNCPKCGAEVTKQDISVIYGVREGVAEILAEGDLTLAFCCGTAILADKPKTEKIEVPPQPSIILPT